MNNDRKLNKIRALGGEARELAREGEHKKALAKFKELESLDRNEADWPRRAADCHRALGNRVEQLSALSRAADCYVGAGVPLKAIALCKMMLAVDPEHPAALGWMAKLRAPVAPPVAVTIVETRVLEQPVVSSKEPATPAGPTFARKLAAEKGLAALAHAFKERAAERRRKKQETPVPSATSVSSGNWQIVADSELHASVAPAKVVPSAPPLRADSAQMLSLVPGSASLPDDHGRPSGMFRLAIDTTQQERLELALRQARSVLPAVPIFSELDPKSLEELLQKSRLVQLLTGDVVFKQGDPPESLYVVVNGSVVLIDEAEPRTELYCLGENEFFGEAALISNEPRSASVEACEPCDLLAFDRETMSGCIGNNPDVVPVLLRFLRERMVEHLVRTSPLFTGFQTAERRALTRRFEFIQLEQGSHLIRQGTRSPGLFVMLSGSVDVVRTEASSETRLATLERGGVFGEMSLLAHSGAVADVRGARAGFVLMLPAESFREVIMTHPQFLEVVTSLCEARRAGLLEATSSA